MKNPFSKFMSWFGAEPSSRVDRKVETVDPRTILFSLPTIAADELEFVMPSREEWDQAPQFHEDNWAQIEFFPRDRLDEIQGRLREFDAFEQQHRASHGWKKIYSRQIRRSVFSETRAIRIAFESTDGHQRLPSPILTTSARPLGQVKDGFSVRLPGPLLLYGLETQAGISILAVRMETGCDDRKLTDAFVELNRSSGLILVDWPGQMVLVSTTDSGQIKVWRP